MSYKVVIEKLRMFCNPHTLNCMTSEELKPEKTLIVQERLAHSWQSGLGIKAAGFKIYVAGLPGTGKMTMVDHFLKQVAKELPTPLACAISYARVGKGEQA